MSSSRAWLRPNLCSILTVMSTPSLRFVRRGEVVALYDFPLTRAMLDEASATTEPFDDCWDFSAGVLNMTVRDSDSTDFGNYNALNVGKELMLETAL